MIMKYLRLGRVWMDSCKAERAHEKACQGINDGQPWTYMSFDDAVKLGQKQLDEVKARKDQPVQPQLKVAEVARYYQLIKVLEQQVKDYCIKNAAAKACPDRSPRKIALEIYPQEKFYSDLQKEQHKNAKTQ